MQLQARQCSFYKWDFQEVEEQSAGKIRHRKEPWTFISKEMAIGRETKISQ